MHGKSKREKNSLGATCPACGHHIRLRKMPGRGQFITCSACDSMLAVARLSPMKLEWAFEEPFENSHSRSRHYVENVDGRASEWYDEDDSDDFENNHD